MTREASVSDDKLGPAPRLLCSVPTSRTFPQRPLGDWAGNWTYLRLAGKIIQLNSWVSKKCNGFFSPQRFLEWDYIDYIMIVMVFPRYYWWFSHHYINIINDCDPSSPVSQMQPLLQYSTDGILLNHPTGTYPPHWQLSTKEPVHKWAQHGDNAQKKMSECLKTITF